MSTFTMRLADVMSYGYDVGLQAADYPLYDEAHRAALNKRIMDHYWFQEIGAETVEQFRFFLNRKLREIMPYYNQLYTSTQMQFDPLKTVEFTDTLQSAGTNTASSTDHQVANSTSETDSDSRTVQSEFPQTQLSGAQDYASSAADSSSKTLGTGGSTTDATNNVTAQTGSDSTRTMSGRQGSASMLLMEYRQAMLNVDMLVVAELAPCFMSVWDNGDSFTSGWPGLYGTVGFMGGFGPW